MYSTTVRHDKIDGHVNKSQNIYIILVVPTGYYNISNISIIPIPCFIKN